MKTYKAPSRLLVVILLVAVFIQPAKVESQCVVSTTSMSTFGSTITVLKILSMATTCTRTVTMAASCDPTTAVTASLFASAMTSTIGTMSVACGWNCGCGQVTIDGADGLPVELMDFSVDDGDAN